MTERAPAVLIGWDAAELGVIEQLCVDGRLPALQSLRARGCFGSLGSADLPFAGGVWPTFYTGKAVPWHGVYHNRLWRPELMRNEVIDGEWLRESPFWERLGPHRRAVIVDVPMTVTEPGPINGVQLAGWGTHDLMHKGAFPAQLWQQVRAQFGPARIAPEFFGPQGVSRLLHLRQSLLDGTEQMTRICEWLLREERWDLFLVVLGAPHRGGHYLWDLSQVGAAEGDAEGRRHLESALTEIYQACDRALARLLAATPPHTRVLVFALHGMERNSGWAERLPDILAKIQAHGETTPPNTGVLYRLKRTLPLGLTQPITTRLPQAVRNRLVALWSGRMFDWGATRWFPLEMDHAGYLRLNLKGREAQGIVNPGEEYERLCRDLAQALHSFRDIGTGQPIVARIDRLADIAPQDTPYRDLLPDLVVTWGPVSAIGSPGVISETFGEVRWPDAAPLPSGRSGNHRGHGWFAAAGDGIGAGTRTDGHQIVDLLPTVLRWIDSPPAADLQGTPISALVANARWASASLRHKMTKSSA